MRDGNAGMGNSIPTQGEEPIADSVPVWPGNGGCSPKAGEAALSCKVRHLSLLLSAPFAASLPCCSWGYQGLQLQRALSVSPAVDTGLGCEGLGAQAPPAFEPPSPVPGNLSAKVKL